MIAKRKEIAPVEKRAAIYARVSSQKQKEEATIESQIEVLRAHALQEGYIVPDNWLFIDNGISGEVLQRAALDELRDIIRLEPVDAVLIYSPDRLSRKYSYQLILMEEFRRYGVDVCFLKKAPVTDTPEAVMFNHLQGILAEYEKALILDRSRRGRLHKAKQGDPGILPSVPFGYKKVRIGSQVVIQLIEVQAEYVKDIFKWFVYDKMTLGAIARKLTEDHVRSHKGAPWSPSTIKDIIANPAYIGTAYYGKTKTGEGDQSTIRNYRSGKFLTPKRPKKHLPEEQWYPINMPQIISESDFEMAREQLKKNRELAARNTKEPTLLQGLLACGECGHRFYKRSRKHKETTKAYYHCQSHAQRNLEKCCNSKVEQEKLDALVYSEVIKLLKNPTIVREELSRRAKEVSNPEKIVMQEATLKKEIQKISIERNRLLDAYQEGTLELRELQVRNQELISRKHMLDKEIRALEALNIEREQGQNLDSIFEDVLENINKNAMELSFNEKRELIRLLVEEVIVGKDQIKIIHCISPIAIANSIHGNCQLKTDGV